MADKKRRLYGKLVNMKLSATAGVDHPATLTEGWMVMKNSTNQATPSNAALLEVVDKAEEIKKDALDLLDTLKESVVFLKDAPDPIKQAVTVLTQWLAAFHLTGNPDAMSQPGSDAQTEDQAYAPYQAAKSLIDDSNLPDDLKTQLAPGLTELFEFIADETEDEGVEKHRGVARKRLARLQAAVKALQDMFDMFADQTLPTQPAGEPSLLDVSSMTKEAHSMAEEVKDAATETATEAVAKAEETATEATEATTEAATTSEATLPDFAGIVEAALTKAMETVAAKIDEVKTELATKLDDIDSRVDVVEKAKGSKRSLEGQDDKKVEKSLFAGIIPTRNY